MPQSLKDTFERCCRLCAEEQDVTIMIFSKEAEAMLLKNKLNRYLLIEVDEDDKLPKNICIQCCTKLQSACDFIDTARKAQEVLLERSFMMNQIISNNKCMVSLVQQDIKQESEDCFQNNKQTEIEVNVDPMVVLQNSEDNIAHSYDDSPMEEVIYLHHGLDTENVTIKLIKKGDIHSKDEKNSPPSKSQLSHDSDGDDDNDEKKSPCVKPFQCTSCERSFCSDLALKNHSWTHYSENKVEKQYICHTCSEGFHYKYDLAAHLKEHRRNGICQLCGRKFRTERTYINHMSVHLPSTKSYSCKICGRSYNTWGGLKAHSVTHSSDRPYKCQFCMKCFKRNQDLKFHINQHTGAKPYKCPFCEKCFASSGNCYSHRTRMHPGEQPEEHIKMSNIKTSGEEQPQAILPNPINMPDTQITPIPDNVLNTDDNLVTVNGITKYQCHLCDHRFVMKDNFSYHMYQHTGEKPFRCAFCTDEFVTRRGLLIHHDNNHPDKVRPLSVGKNTMPK